ncbi:uncharacterized protein LOC117341184 isoform X3 [Pecten maximus]|uniref:uncharacterized protein LOC117341184 isoform X3 n=1 Tax=Pecten maximus TaxID=6579 RepID=UPI00145836E3|nr:uncharacterized protein LOC117341184 isoform X3 [Pecten maximus]XP_033758927.1 uncharacterized protein LOC117341184 isoform X3 [Pecten maximus]
MGVNPGNDDMELFQSQQYEGLNLADVANAPDYEVILDKEDRKEQLQSQQYEDLNVADIGNSSEYEDFRDNEHRTPCNDCEDNAYESLGRTSVQNVYDDLRTKM